MESIQRFFIGGLLFGLVHLSKDNVVIFATVTLCAYFMSFIELLTLPTKYQKIHRILLLINYLTIVNILFNLNRYNEISKIIIYNSTSDAIQYIVGRTIGNHKPFSFTSKSIEGYISGLVLTHYIFNYDYFFILLNMIGMFGGMLSSILKRRLKKKHWSNILGHHGGINDRLDSLSIPIIMYLSFSK